MPIETSSLEGRVKPIETRHIKGIDWVNLSGVHIELALSYFPRHLQAEKIVLFPDLCRGRSPIPTGCAIELDETKMPNWRKLATGDVGCGEQLFEPETPLAWEDFESSIKLWDELFKKLKGQRNKGLSDLGSGNHFLDAVVPNDGSNKVMFVVHTGSRNESKIVDQYLSDPGEFDRAHQAAVNWARDNRHAIRGHVEEIYGFKTKVILDKEHNNIERLANGHVIIRKGAAKLANGDLGLIPSTLADHMALVEGTTLASYLLESMSHGTGRLMSRRAAKTKAEELGLKYYEDLRHLVHIPSGISNASIKTEAPFCYRKLDDCLALLSNSVRVKTYLSPIAYIGQI